MSAEQGFALFALVMFLAAMYVNREGMRLLDEAKRHADRWERERAAAEDMAKEVQTMLDNARRLRGQQS